MLRSILKFEHVVLKMYHILLNNAILEFEHIVIKWNWYRQFHTYQILLHFSLLFYTIDPTNVEFADPISDKVFLGMFCLISLCNSIHQLYLCILMEDQELRELKFLQGTRVSNELILYFLDYFLAERQDI